MKTLGLAGIAIGAVAAFAQPVCPPVIQWQKSFGTPGYEDAKSVQETLDGGFIVGGLNAFYPVAGPGNKTSPNYGGHDFWVVRTDADGNKVWDRSYGGNDEDNLEALARTSDGGFILGGVTWNASSGGNKTSTNYGQSDVWVVRIDAAGAMLWDRSFGGENFDFLSGIQQTSDGGFIFAAASSSPTNSVKTAPQFGGDDFWIVRLDANGNKLWDRTYGGELDDRPRVIRQTADGGFLIGGTTEGVFSNFVSRGFGRIDYWVVRIDATGNKVWDNIFGGSERDQLQGMALTSDGGCLVGGWSYSPDDGNKTSIGHGSADFWVVWLDATGNKVWEQSYGGDGDDTLDSVSANSDGSFLLAGYSNAQVYFPADFLLIRIDANGNEIWQTTLGGENYDLCHAAHQTTDGGYIVAGSSLSLGGDRHGRGFGGDDYWLVKLTPESPGDCDHDGVPNAQDQCDGTPLGTVVNAQGCSIQQLCPCTMASHEEYVACVRDAARAFEQAGVISNPLRRQVIENARAASCPPSSGPHDGFIFGLPHRAIDNAALNFQPFWFGGLSVYPQDGNAEPLYGVSVSLGEADSGLFLYPDGGRNSFGDAWIFDVSAYGHTAGGNNNDLISTVMVRKPYYESYDVNVDLSPLRPDSITIQVLLRGTVIGERTVPGSVGSLYIQSNAYLDPRGNPYWRMPDGSIGAIIEFTSPYFFQEYGYLRINIGGPEDEGFRGEKIFIRANKPRRTVQHISRVDAVAGGGLWEFRLYRERLGMFGHPHQALGAILFNASNGRLQVNTLEELGPEDFAAVLVEAPAAASRLEIDLQPVGLEESGATLVAYPAGESEGDPGAGAMVFGEMRIGRSPDELTFACDYRALFDPTSAPPALVRLEVLKDGRLTGATVFSNALASGTIALSQGRAPQITGCRATMSSNGVPTLGVGFARAATFTTADGVQFSGNHIRVTPVNAMSRVGSISTVTLEMRRHESITIVGERSTLVPPTLSVQPAAGQLVLSWPDSTRLYSLESAASLSGPFTVVTNEVEMLDSQNKLTLSISTGTSRFFRLAGPVD